MATESIAALTVTPYMLAERFIGTRELRGQVDNPMVLAMLRLDAEWPAHDEVPWCSAFVNWIAWLLRLPRSKSLLARSWLQVGQAIDLTLAQPGFDVVILARANSPVDSTVINAPGHVGFFSGWLGDKIVILGSNQDNAVSLKPYPFNGLLGVRRLR